MKNISSMFMVAVILLAAWGATESGGLTLSCLVLSPVVLLSLYICKRIDPKDTMDLPSIFLLGVTLRWVVAALVHILVYRSMPGLFGPDEIWYDEAARYYAEYLHGRVPDPFPDSYAGGVIWVSSAFYYVFGWLPIMPKFMNGIMGAWASVFTALIGERLFSRTVGKRAGFIAAMVPSLVLWSSINTKDMATLFGSSLSLLAFLHLREKTRPELWFLFVFGLLYTASNRPYEIVFVGIGVMASFVLADPKKLFRNLALAAVLGVALMFIFSKTGALDMATDGDQSAIDRINMYRVGYAEGTGSAIDYTMVDTSTPAGIAAWAPIGLVFFWLAPFPFTGGSIISLATSPEMIIWYLLLPSVFRGLRLAIQKRTRLVMPLVAYVMVSSVGWATVVTNVGTLYRFRAQVMYLPLICMAADQIRREHAARMKEVASRPAPMPKFALVSSAPALASTAAPANLDSQPQASGT